MKPKLDQAGVDRQTTPAALVLQAMVLPLVGDIEEPHSRPVPECLSRRVVRPLHEVPLVHSLGRGIRVQQKDVTAVASGY